MYKIHSVMSALYDLAPLSQALPGDSVGLIAGRTDKTVTKALITLDITRETIHLAKNLGVNLMISHHCFFRQTPRATSESREGELLLSLCEQKIGAICLHTNLDAAMGGVNDVLASRAGIRGALGVLDKESGIGRFGTLSEIFSAPDYAKFCKKALGSGVVRYHDAGRRVKLVAVCGGAGGEYVELAFRSGCDSLVTADVKHSQFLEAAHWGINLFDCGHFATENVILPPIGAWLHSQLPGLELAVDSHSVEPYKCL